MAATLRHLRDLFHDGTSVGLGDGQLLARYAQSRDESAFEALVARHGPMVLATCRTVLKYEHDVEDAFQATFLVLARKARSIRAGEALGGWLHRVAYRTAVQASVASRRRRQHELEAAMAPQSVSQRETELDIAAIVHQELDRLPDRQKLPVILCDLEGLTYEQAAHRLCWTEPTLRHRLVGARQRLRDRLIRRGVTAVAVGAALDAAAGARAAVPAALARSAVAAATGGATATTVTALSNAVIRGMLMSRLKIASAGILAVITFASAGAVVVGTFGQQKPDAAKRATAGAARAPAQSGPGIEGRIVDLEGRPVAGASVRVTYLGSAPNNDLGRWLDQARDRGVAYPSEGLGPGTAPARPINNAQGSRPVSLPPSLAATTGPDGRFRLTGVGPAQVAAIQVSGPKVATTTIYAVGRDGAEVRAALHQGLTPSQIIYHARRFDYAAAPGKPIEGTVRDKDTGRPLAGVGVRAAVYVEHSLVGAHGIEATTDDRGHYRLDGLPKAPAYRLLIEPAFRQPYPKATFRAPGDTPAFEPVKFDLAIKRGITIRGMVTDKATGQPVRAAIDVFAFADNPHVREFPGFQMTGLARSFGINGRYEAVALPGRGLIAVRVGGYLPRYRAHVGAEAIKGYDPRLMGFRTMPQTCHVGNYHALAQFDLDPKAESATLDIQVDPCRTIAVTPVDPDGRPVAGTMAAGVSNQFASSEYPQSSSTIEIDAVEPGRPRRLTVTHTDRKLVGSLYLKGDETGPLTIRLQPFATVMGRIVDEEGRPRGGLGVLSAGGSRPAHPDEHGILPGGDRGGGIRIGHDGRFRIEGLVPGLKYGAYAGEGMTYLGDLFHDLQVRPGEVKDLGDLKLMPRNLGK